MPAITPKLFFPTLSILIRLVFSIGIRVNGKIELEFIASRVQRKKIVTDQRFLHKKKG